MIAAKEVFFILATATACAFSLSGCVSSATGKKMHDEMQANDAVYDDRQLQAYVNRIGQQLVVSSGAAPSNFTFTVLDSPDINAFALPGGYIYINRGLLAYLENEAELAAVLAHEIGHITARHHSQRQTAAVTNKVVATTAYVLTGSGDLADASNMYGTELISGFGREMELEADALGARYMHQTGYDPQAMLAVIGVLTDQQRYQRVKARDGGRKVGTYHGLYATHPRNDQRLQKVIKTAGELDLETPAENPALPGEFQRHIEGLVWGDSVQSERAEDRYYHNKLGFTFERPPGWSVNAGSRAIIASAADGGSQLTITIRRRDQSTSPQAVLEDGAGKAVTNGALLTQAGLKGYTATLGARRLAVIDYGNLSYLFEGQAATNGASDATLLAMIESFRPMHPREQQASNGRYLRYIQVPRGATMASLATGLQLQNAEAQLRLLNGLYPSGEPRTGDWLKIIR